VASEDPPAGADGSAQIAALHAYMQPKNQSATAKHLSSGFLRKGAGPRKARSSSAVGHDASRSATENATNSREVGHNATNSSLVGYNAAGTKVASLFCFALMQPDSYEVDLLMSLWKSKVGIFACDNFTVFSSGVFELVPSVITESIGSMKCDYGGPFNLALNSDIFVRVWKRVISDGLWKASGWSVKVDPDAVFLAGRLRENVRYSDPEATIYLNNCDQGLHGPIEVIARGGMRAYAAGFSDCETSLSKEFSWAGEDVFLRHCLGMLNINRVDDFRLLSEDHCMWENPLQNGCVSGKVAFHPFKSPDAYFKCLVEANSTGPPAQKDEPDDAAPAPERGGPGKTKDSGKDSGRDHGGRAKEAKEAKE